ncbi:uncharacterized protein LOC129602451 [Paramacrobiotus metropolitanus]|uniref:uncharacterized protein LOC129602451 n=1 Tax=Paramacrobiotus metropolitanus TaxID=2943436 RepID=UPI0024465250|nr:uncharacterized protein LOC129602451 [Paramacrobiotus metropolitanus]
MSDIRTTVSTSTCEEDDDQRAEARQQMSASTGSTAAETTDPASDSVESLSSSADQLSPENACPDEAALEDISVKFPSKLYGGLAESIVKGTADAMMKYCTALRRPDYKAKKRTISIAHKIVVRASKTANHVLVMGTVNFMLDPLPCPFSEQQTACTEFRAREPRLLQAHLQTKHGLHNVLLNFVCPCPARLNGKRICPVVRFDPGDMYMRRHLREDHRKYSEEVYAALVSAEKGEDPQVTQKRQNFMRRTRRVYFPGWTNKKGELFPSQIIPDRIVFPTKVDEHKQIRYICKIDACRKEKAAKGHRCAPGSVQHHLWTQHESRFDPGTNFYIQCPATEVCQEMVYAGDHQLESHVKALHPEMLGWSADYSEAAKKVLSESVEDQIPTARIGEALTNHSLPPDDASQLFLHFTSVLSRYS